jgi:hypothetical protein
MERLISSSPLLRRAPAARPRAHRPSSIACLPCRGGGLRPTLRPPPLASLLSRHRPTPPPVPVASSGGAGAAPSVAPAEGADDAASNTRRCFFRKVSACLVRSAQARAPAHVLIPPSPRVMHSYLVYAIHLAVRMVEAAPEGELQMKEAAKFNALLPKMLCHSTFVCRVSCRMCSQFCFLPSNR